MAFDVVGELAAQPGGQELSALAARVRRVDPEALHGMGRGLAAMTEGVDGSLRALEGHGADVRAAWRGRGAEAATGYLDELGRAGGRTLAAAGRIRARIDGAGHELTGMRREVDAHVSRALDAARRARAEALADPARAPLAEQLAARAMIGPTADARAAVERAETALGDAATALRELAGDLATFSRLPTPDVRPIAPPAGSGPLGWTVTTPPTGAPADGCADGSASGGAPVSAAPEAGDLSAAVEDTTADATEDAAGDTTGGTTDERPEDGTVTGGPQGEVGDWIRKAVAILQAEGVPLEKMDPGDIATIIEHESGGDPEAVNDWDSNADRGTPSQGLMQTIGPTFEAHKLDGHDDITDPIDNILAGVRYAIDRYGSVSQVPGVEAVARGDAYVGY